jgi:hypothetical protein
MKLKYLLLFILITSCKSNHNTLYEFDPRTLKEKKITLSEIADDITYIPLDNSLPISLIYSPRYLTNNSIYLSALNNGIIAFDRKGKLLRKIGSIGRGPGEYVNYTQFTVNDKNETVYVLDGNIIKVYSKTGSFLRSISLKEFGDGADAVEFNNSKLFVSYPLQFTGIKYDWIILDTLGNLVKKKERTIPSFTSNWLIGGGMYKFENGIHHWSPYKDTVFSILPDLNYEASFIFSQGEHRLPKSDIDDIFKIKLYFNPYTVFETRRFLLIKYLFDKRVTIALIDKKSGKSYLTYLESGPSVIGDNFIGGIYNDLDGGLMFQPENYFSEESREFLVGLVNAYQIKALLTSNEFKNSRPKNPQRKQTLEKLANSLKETDNPVLVLVRLKK